MSDKQQKYQEMHRQYEDSPGALNAQMMEQENLERQKGLPGDDAYKFLMDADQLKEYYENRNRDTAENSFKVRTRYYFEDLNRAEAKAKRYETLAGKEAAIEAYQQKHGGRQTHKRVNDVKNASSSFRKMQQKMADQARKNQNRQNLTPLQKYTQREEIMKLRMDGMVAAAQLKSKPGNMHHLMTRAKYSCYMILKDQLTHLIKEPQSAQDKRKLEGKLKAVNSKLDSIFLDLKKYTPSVQKQWQEGQFTDRDYLASRTAYEKSVNDGVEVSEETLKMLAHIRCFHRLYENVQWPARCVYKTGEGNAPINPAERKLQEWNNRVEEIRQNGSDYAKQRVEEEGIRLFMNTEFPSAKELKKMGAKYLEDNFRTFYEMTHIALPYYQREIQKGKGFISRYAEEHKDFKEKLDYVASVEQYLNHRLQKDYGIKPDEAHAYAINAEGLLHDEDRDEFQDKALDRAERFYGIAMDQNSKEYDLMPDIPTQALRPLAIDDDDDEADEDYDDDEQVIEHRQARREQAAPQQVRQQEEQVAPQQQVQQEQNIEIRENRLFSDMIVKEEKKEEEKKEEVQENVIIEEEKEEPEQIFQTKLAGDVVRKNKLAGDVRRKNAAPDEDDGPLVEDDISDQKKISFEDAAEQVEKILAADREKAAKEKEEEDRKKAAKAEEDRKVAKQIAEGKRIVAEREAKERKAAENKAKEQKSAKKAAEEPKNEIIEEPKNEIIEEPKNEIIVEKKKTVDLGIKDPEEMKALGLTQAHFGKKLTKKQKEELEFAKTRHEISRFYKQGEDFENHEAYQKIFRKLGIDTTIGRSLTALMRPVMFDKNGNPLPKYLENHHWNLRWLNAWLNKDEKEKKKMFADYYPHAMDAVKDSDLPEVKLSKSQMTIMRNFRKAHREVEEIEKKQEARKNELKKLKKDVSYAALCKDPKYAELNVEIKAAIKKEKEAKAEAMNVVQSFVATKQFKTWLNGAVNDQSEAGFLRMMAVRTQTSVDGLRELFPPLKDFEKQDPKRARRDAMINALDVVRLLYLQNQYGVATGQGGQYIRNWHKNQEFKPGELGELEMTNVLTFMTSWMDYNYEETQGKDNEDAEIAELKEENQKFNKKDYPFYKKLKSFKEFTDHPVYRNYDIEETKKKYNLKDGSISLDRLARIGFRPVTFDKLSQPVTKEDEANHAWNLKWMRAWQEDDIPTREAMIGEQLSRIFEGISMPVIKLSKAEKDKLMRYKEAYDTYERAKAADDKCKLNAPEKKQLEQDRAEANKAMRSARKETEAIQRRFGSVYAKWLEGLVDRQDLNMLNLGQISGSLDALQKIHPSVAYFFEKNPALKTLTGMVDLAVRSYTGQVLGKKCRIKMSTKVEIQEEMEHHDDLERYDQDMADEGLEFLKDMVLYEEQKKKKTVPFVPLSDNEVTLTDQKEREEFAENYKKNQNLTPKSYRVVKVLQGARTILNHEEYRKAYEKGKDVLEGGHQNYSRDATLVMRRVDFDGDQNPKTAQDKENHKWNMQWLKAIEEDDFELREKMLAEEIQKRFWIDDLPMPSEKLLALHRKVNDEQAKKGWEKTPEGQEAWGSYKQELERFKQEMERYTEKKLEEKDVAFFYELQTGQSLDALRKSHPSLQKYLDDNPEIDQRYNMVFSFMVVSGSYLSRKYLIDDFTGVDGITDAKHIEGKVEQSQKLEDNAIIGHLDKCLAYQNVKKQPAVPYQTIITEEDRKRKEKRAARKAEKAKAAREASKDKKKIEDLAKKYLKINKDFDVAHIGILLKTNRRGEMLKNREYLDWAKKIKLGGDLNGLMSLGLETIEMDEKGNVLPEYEETHKRNLAWLQLCYDAGETGNTKELEQQVEKIMTQLVKDFSLPDKDDLTSLGSYRLFMKEPVKMKTMVQRLQAYEKMKRISPELSVTGAEQKQLRENIKLLLEAIPLLIDNVKVHYGIDFSGDAFKVIPKKERSDSKETAFEKKKEAYLKARDEFLKKE